MVGNPGPRAHGTLRHLQTGFMAWSGLLGNIVKGTSRHSNTEKCKASWGLGRRINYCLFCSCYCCLRCTSSILHLCSGAIASLSRKSIDLTEALGFVCAPGAVLGPLGCACVAGVVLDPLGWVCEHSGQCWTPGAVHPCTGYSAGRILLLADPGSQRRHTRPLLVELSSCRTVALPLGRRLGVSDKLRPVVQPNATLEGFYILLGRTPKEVSVPCVPVSRASLPRQAIPSPYPDTQAQPN